MKKGFSFFLLLLCFNSFSQFSVWIDNKWGFKTPGSYDQLGGYGNSTGTSNGGTFESKKFCFGDGYQGTIGARYTLMSNFGVDLGVGYLIGRKSETKSTSNSGSGSSYASTNDIKARMLRINLGVSYMGDKKISPLMKIGLIGGFARMLTHYETVSTMVTYTYNPNPPYNTIQTTTTTTTIKEEKYYGGFSIGFYAALGVAYKLSDKMTLALSLDVVKNDFAPKKAVLQTWTANGVNKLTTATTSEKEAEFVNNYTEAGPTIPTSPSKAPRFSIPLSSYGPSFTVIFSLGKKKESSTPLK